MEEQVISGAHKERYIMDQEVKPKRRNRARLLSPADTAHPLKSESEDLNLHTQLCAERYKALEQRLDALDERLSALETKVANIKMEMSQGFTDIKFLIERQSNQRSIQLIATAGTVIVALLGVIGYIIAR